MNKPKFTPGPYTVETDSASGAIWIGSDTSGSEGICDLYHFGPKDGAAKVWRKDNCEANAYLLATAPELYDAVLNLLGVLDTPIARRKLGGDFSAEAIAGARAVLAKVRGEVVS